MKTMLFTWVSLLCFALSADAALPEASRKKWKLVWSDEFDTNTVDTSKWKHPERAHPDWCQYQSKDPRCTYVKDGKLYLRGIVNDDKSADPAPYLTGGLISEGKFAFRHGKIEIRAKLECAQGAWPALWLLGEGLSWPDGGEIDIMEHLNHDTIFYQTVHSPYTLNGNTNNPPQGGTAALDPLQYNIFSVEIYPDRIDFLINDQVTFTYPKLESGPKEQWPFDNEFYILLSQQLEGNWVGKADPNQLPVQMIIDYVRVYEPRKR